MIVTTGPIFQVGCVNASSTVTSLKSFLFLNGPPLAVRINFETSFFVPARSACANAECSESTGIICPGLAARKTKSPPATSDSLFASATLFPTPKAFSVGPSPTDPVIALSITSTGIAATCAAAPFPSITFTPGNASRSNAPSPSTATTFTPKARACSTNRGIFDPPAASATTRN